MKQSRIIAVPHRDINRRTGMSFTGAHLTAGLSGEASGAQRPCEMRTDTSQYAWQLPRHASVSAWRALNTALDVVFYDVGSLSSPERSSLSAHLVPEGSIVIVPPRGSDRPLRTLLPWDFVREQADKTDAAVDAIVVAGVGSSAIGTAALARDVADHLRRPVAGIVSGFGMADALTEALGGWFVLGATNALRHVLARALDANGLKDHVRDAASHRDMNRRFESAGLDRDRFIYGSPDSTMLLYLLLELGSRIKLLVGHSKGNYSIENALQGWLEAHRKTRTPISPNLCIVTLGAVLRFPPEFANVHQFIGGVDGFGMINSRPLVEHVRVSGAWHSLNTRLPGHLSVIEALQAVGVG